MIQMQTRHQNTQVVGFPNETFEQKSERKKAEKHNQQNIMRKIYKLVIDSFYEEMIEQLKRYRKQHLHVKRIALTN